MRRTGRFSDEILNEIRYGGPGGLRSLDFRLPSLGLEGRRSIQAELRARGMRTINRIRAGIIPLPLFEGSILYKILSF
jgi:hypothetical protein